MTEVAHDQRLTQRATQSSLWMMAARLLVRLSDLGLLMVLTRLLAPADFGLVTIAASVIAILDVVTDLPLNMPLLRLKTPEPSHMHTAFSLGALRGALIFGCACMLAQPLAGFFGDPRLSGLITVLAIGPALYNLRSPRMAILFKKLEFRQAFMVEVGGKILGVIAAVIGAFLLQNYWALTLSPVVSRVASMVLSYVFAPYRPAFSLRQWRYFWTFLGWVVPSQVVVALSWQFDRLFLGRAIPADQLGFYGLAANVNAILEQTVRRAITVPLVSSFVLTGEDHARLQRGYTLADSAIFTLGAPIYLATFLFSDPLVRLAFGASWQPAAPLLGGLALAMLPALMRIPFRPLALALGATKDVFTVALYSLLFRVPAVAGGFALDGVRGVIWGIALSNIGNAVVAMICIRRLLGLPVRLQAKGAFPTLCALLPMALFGLWSAQALQTITSPIALFGFTLTYAIVAITLYAATLSILWIIRGKPNSIEKIFLSKVLNK